MTEQRIGISKIGEAIVEHELVARGWHVVNVNFIRPNNPGFDLIAIGARTTVCVEVKVSTDDNNQRWQVQTLAKDGVDFIATGRLFRTERPDWVVFVRLVKPSLAVREFYVVPADVVESMVHAQAVHYYSHPKRDGIARRRSRMTAITWGGRDSPTIIGHDFARKWERYRNAWQLLHRSLPVAWEPDGVDDGDPGTREEDRHSRPGRRAEDLPEVNNSKTEVDNSIDDQRDARIAAAMKLNEKQLNVGE